MDAISEKDYMLSYGNLTEDEYNYWKKLTHSMTTAARMMGLVENEFTQNIFRKALSTLMDFEKAHNIQFYELGITLAGIETSKLRHSML